MLILEIISLKTILYSEETNNGISCPLSISVLQRRPHSPIACIWVLKLAWMGHVCSLHDLFVVLWQHWKNSRLLTRRQLRWPQYCTSYCYTYELPLELFLQCISLVILLWFMCFPFSSSLKKIGSSRGRCLERISKLANRPFALVFLF